MNSLTQHPAIRRPFVRRLLPALLLAVALAVPPLAGPIAAERLVPQSEGQVLLSFAPVVKRASPAVVNIYASRRVVRRAPSALFNDPFFKRFFGPDLGRAFGGMTQERVENSLGSGVIVDPDGVIVTNRHVVEGGDDITVALPDRREFEARVLLSDPHSDLAILQIDTGDEALPHLELAEMAELEVGDLVLAIGNPFGLRQSVTSGIVSAVGRTGVSRLDTHSFIQTDAAINPGNSGGALVTLDGRLAGVNTLIFSEGGGSDGIGFAIPADLVRAVVADALAGDGLRRPWLGAAGQAVTSDIARSLDLGRPHGVLVSNVHPRGAAAESGLQRGDIITAIDGRTVDDPQALKFQIATRRPGDEVDMEVQRDGTPTRIRIRLVEAPEDPPSDRTAIDGRNPLAGATVGNLSPSLALELGLDPFVEGVVVLEIARDSRAGYYRLQRGDILVSLNEQELRLVDDLLQELEADRGGWHLRLRRGTRILNLEVRS